MNGIFDTPWGNALKLEQKVQHICARQERYGWLFDKETAITRLQALHDMRNKIDEEVMPRLPLRVIPGIEMAKPFKKDGALAKRVTEYTDAAVSGPFTKLSFEPMNLGSVAQVKEFLFTIGWQPDEWNHDDDGNKTSPKLSESSLERLDHPLGKHIAQREVVKHRIGLVAGLIENVRADGRIPSRINTLGAATHRATHSVIVNLPKAGEDKQGNPIAFYGQEIRSLFIAPAGCTLVGGDAKGLQLRCLAHYINNPDFTKEVIAGDPHQGNWDVLEELCPTRPIAKNLLYCLIFGGQDPKLATTAGFNGSDKKLRMIGGEIRSRLVGRVPGFLELTQGVQAAAKTRGYLLGPDGRKVWLRSAHAALNTLLQHMEAFIMKLAMCFLYDMIEEARIHAEQLTWQHDEFVHEVEDQAVDVVVDMYDRCIPMAGEFMGSNCPLETNTQKGVSWATVH